MKSIDVEHHMVTKHSQTSILKPQTYCFHPALLRLLWCGFLKYFLMCIPGWRYPQAAASKTCQNQRAVCQDGKRRKDMVTI